MKTFLSVLLWIYFRLSMLGLFVLILPAFLIVFPFNRSRQIPNRVLRGLAVCVMKPVPGWIIFMVGHPGMIFPEGTRSVDGSLKRFESGAFKLARDYNFLIYPLVSESGCKAMPPGDWKFELNQMFANSVLEPVDPSQFVSVEVLSEHVRGIIHRELETIRKQSSGHS